MITVIYFSCLFVSLLYRGLTDIYHAQFKVAWFLVNVNTTSAFLSKMFDFGDLPVLTFGNCVLKTGMIKWLLKLYVRFFNVFNFFSKSQKHDFLRFLSCARFLEHWLPLLLLLCGVYICWSKRFSSSMICGQENEARGFLRLRLPLRLYAFSRDLFLCLDSITSST